MEEAKPGRLARIDLRFLSRPALLGTAMAYGAVRIILTLVPPDTIPDDAEVVLNLPVLVFAIGVYTA